MKNTIITLAALAVAALAVIPEDAEARRRGGGGRSGGSSKKLRIPRYSAPSAPSITPHFNYSPSNSSSPASRSNSYAPAYMYQGHQPDQAQGDISKNTNGQFSLYKKDCLEMEWKLKTMPENVQFMCSYLGVPTR